MQRTTLKKLLNERIQQYIQIVDSIPLDGAKKRQLLVVFINFIRILEKLANRHLLKNDVTNVTVIILSALVPILINIIPTVKDGEAIHDQYLTAATILSVILAILNGLRQSYKFSERWQNYRETAEQLILEGQSYFALSGKYASFANHDVAFTKFIETINALRTKQISNYISQLMTVSDKEIAQSVSEEVKSRLTDVNAAKEKITNRKLINSEINDYVKNDQDIAYFETDHDRKLITLYANNQQFKGIDKFTFKDNNLMGIVYKVNTAYADVEIQGELGISSAVKNKDMPNRDFGSAGCILKRSDDTLVFVTCYHVVKHNNQDWDLFIPGRGHDDIIDSSGHIIGKIIDAEKSAELDTALVAIDTQINYDELLPGQVTLARPVFIDEDNMNEYADVYILSRMRNYKQIQGRLAEVAKTVTLNYGTKSRPDKKNLDNLMIVHYVSTEPFSLTGDSGSLVFSGDGTAIGIIVGGDLSRASFVIPFSTISDHYNLKFD